MKGPHRRLKATRRPAAGGASGLDDGLGRAYVGQGRDGPAACRLRRRTPTDGLSATAGVRRSAAATTSMILPVGDPLSACARFDDERRAVAPPVRVSATNGERGECAPTPDVRATARTTALSPRCNTYRIAPAHLVSIHDATLRPPWRRHRRLAADSRCQPSENHVRLWAREKPSMR